MRNAILTRGSQPNLTHGELLLIYHFYREVFNPDRYLGDNLSCMESAHQSDVTMRDHWTFGAGYVRQIKPCYFFSNTQNLQPSYLSRNARCGKGAVVGGISFPLVL